MYVYLYAMKSWWKVILPCLVCPQSSLQADLHWQVLVTFSAWVFQYDLAVG